MGLPKSPCGTVAAYRRHLRHGEKPCRECSEANNREGRERRAKRAAAALTDTTPRAPMREVEVALGSGDAEDIELIRQELRRAIVVAPVDKKAPIARALLEVIIRTQPADSPDAGTTTDEGGEDEFTRARRERAERASGA